MVESSDGLLYERDVFGSIPDDDILPYFQELKSCLKKLPKLPNRTRYNGIGIFRLQINV